jgi:methyl-accepting chemotaxis protein
MLAIAYPLTSLMSIYFTDSSEDDMVTPMIFITMVPIITISAFIGGHFLSKSIVTPLHKISAVSKGLASGNFDVKLDTKISNDEIGDLVKAYDELLTNYAQPIRDLKDISVSVSKGNLNQNINITSNGAMKEFIDSYKIMLSNMRSLVSNVQHMTDKVALSSQDLASSSEQMNAIAQQLSSSTQQISKGSSTQVGRIEETVRVIGTMTKGVDNISKNSNDANTISSKASDTAEVGKKAVNEVLTMMDKIHHTVNNSAEVISKLGERSLEITQIVEVITNITDQTNLLALNAAIEAARAGEYGRGFAVVAEEVKNLAEDSKSAADKIATIIGDIQINTKSAVETMTKGTKEVSEGLEIVNKAGKALADVSEMSRHTADIVDFISTATEQQIAGTDVVAASIDEIACIAEESASSAQESASGVEELTANMENLTARAQELSEMSMSLKSDVGKFKIKNNFRRSKIGKQSGDGMVSNLKFV